MTRDELTALQKFVDETRTLLGDITMLRQEIVQLQSTQPLCVTFETDPRSVGATPQKLILTPVQEANLRDTLIRCRQDQLADLEEKFDSLWPPGPPPISKGGPP